jgi:hypothetical protein
MVAAGRRSILQHATLLRSQELLDEGDDAGLGIRGLALASWF